MDPAEANGDCTADGGGSVESGPDQQDAPAARSTRTTRRTASAMEQGAGEPDSATRSNRSAKAPAAIRGEKRGRGRPKQAQEPDKTDEEEMGGDAGDEDAVGGGSAADTTEVVGSEAGLLAGADDEKVQTDRENGGSSIESKKNLGDDGVQEEATDVATIVTSSFVAAVAGIVRQDSSESTDTEVGEGSEVKGEVDGGGGGDEVAVEGIADASAAAEESSAVGGVADQGSHEITDEENGANIDSKDAVGDSDVPSKGAVAAASTAVDTSLVVGVAKSGSLESMDVEGDPGAVQSASYGDSSKEQRPSSPQAMVVVDEQGTDGTGDGATGADAASAEGGKGLNGHHKVGVAGGAETTGAVGAGGTREDGDSEKRAGGTVVASISAGGRLSSSAGMELVEDAYRGEDVVDFEAASEGAGEALSSEDIADPSTGLQQTSFAVSAGPSEDAVEPSPLAAGSTTTTAQVAESSESAVGPGSGTAGPVTVLAGSGGGGQEYAPSSDATSKTESPADAAAAGAGGGPSSGTVATGTESTPPGVAADALAAVVVAEKTEGAASASFDKEAVGVEKGEKEVSVPSAAPPVGTDAPGTKSADWEKSGTARQLHGTGLLVVVKKSKSKEKKGSNSKKSSKSSGTSGKSLAVGDTAVSTPFSSKPAKAKKKELKSATKAGGKVAAKVAKVVAKAGVKTKTGSKIGSKGGSSRSTVEEPAAEKGGKGGKALKGRGRSDKEVS